MRLILVFHVTCAGVTSSFDKPDQAVSDTGRGERAWPLGVAESARAVAKEKEKNDARSPSQRAHVTLLFSTAPVLQFFGRPTFLTVSGQLYAEMLASSLSRVYTFGPTFRAEQSNTVRHLNEFWMLEPEMAHAGPLRMLSPWGPTTR